jgi:hypothetical protein
MPGVILSGVVGFRSSKPNFNGVAGEATIQALNPQRVEKILSLTGWKQLEPGTLNLEVGDQAAEDLLSLTPLWVEDGSTVIYPPGLQHIPIARIAYLYFSGLAQDSGKSQDVLVRRAKNPAVLGRVELYAPISLKGYFGLNERDSLKVKMHAI